MGLAGHVVTVAASARPAPCARKPPHRHTRGIVRESADLLYHLVALWHRAGIDPADVWIEMRSRADTLGIAEKLPKARSDNRCRPIRNVKRPPERNRP